MPAKLISSDAIDRGGTGETPVAGSRFRLVDPIPRGAAWQYDWQRKDFTYHGGKPRCPQCLKSNAVARNGYSRTDIGGEFHCNRCLTCWNDIGEALCYVCGDVFHIPRSSKQYYPWNRDAWEHGSSYHYNSIEHPFCQRCESVIGDDVRHGRRQLRRIVGLR